MIVLRFIAAAVAWALASHAASAGILREDFSTDPGASGWRIHGDPSHFTWSSATGDVDVRWDSTKANAFFVRDLPFTLTRADRFRFRFSLWMEEIGTAAPETTFQIAAGLLRKADAFLPTNFRGSGIHPVWGPRNLIEWDYFPASQSIAPTFSAIAVGTNNTRWAYLDLFPSTLEPRRLHVVELRHDPGSDSLQMTVVRDGVVLVEGSTRLGTRFGDFRVDAFSITSYSGEHQPAGYGGNVLARGRIDSVEVEFPDPPEVRIAPAPSRTPGEILVPEVPGWTPFLERRESGGDWTTLGVPPIKAQSGHRFLDPAPHKKSAYYRIRWDRP